MKVSVNTATEVGEALIDAAHRSKSEGRPYLVLFNEHLQIAYTAPHGPTDDVVLYTVSPV